MKGCVYWVIAVAGLIIVGVVLGWALLIGINMGRN